MVGMWNGAAASENGLIVSQKVKYKLLYDPAIPLLDTVPQRTENRDLNRLLYTHVHR